MIWRGKEVSAGPVASTGEQHERILHDVADAGARWNGGQHADSEL